MDTIQAEKAHLETRCKDIEVSEIWCNLYNNLRENWKSRNKDYIKRVILEKNFMTGAINK